MTSYIAIKKLWSDNDMVEFEITTSDKSSQFCVKAYAGHEALELLIAELDRFKAKVPGGIYDMEFGKFGPEFGNGAFQARLHFYPPVAANCELLSTLNRTGNPSA